MTKPKKKYAVGWGHPPVEHQFKRGQSGNPAGRPKGRRNLKSIFRAVLETEIQVTRGGRKVTVNKGQAFAELVINRALSGETKAWPMVMNLMAQCYSDDGAPTSRDAELEQLESELVKQLLASRHGGCDESSGE